MMFLIITLLSVALLSMLGRTQSMPYIVPLQGKPGGMKTLVLLEHLADKDKYSHFFSDLMSRGHRMNYLQTDDKRLDLKNFGDYLYDNIVLFASSNEGFTSITLGDILDFVNNGGNLLFATSSIVSDGLRLFSESLGVTFDSRQSFIVDHFSYDKNVDDKYDNTTIFILVYKYCKL